MRSSREGLVMMGCSRSDSLRSLPRSVVGSRLRPPQDTVPLSWVSTLRTPRPRVVVVDLCLLHGLSLITGRLSEIPSVWSLGLSAVSASTGGWIPHGYSVS